MPGPFGDRPGPSPWQQPEQAELPGAGEETLSGTQTSQCSRPTCFPFTAARRPVPPRRAKSVGAGSKAAKEGPRGRDRWAHSPHGSVRLSGPLPSTPRTSVLAAPTPWGLRIKLSDSPVPGVHWLMYGGPGGTAGGGWGGQRLRAPALQLGARGTLGARLRSQLRWKLWSDCAWCWAPPPLPSFPFCQSAFTAPPPSVRSPPRPGSLPPMRRPPPGSALKPVCRASERGLSTLGDFRDVPQECGVSTESRQGRARGPPA